LKSVGQSYEIKELRKPLIYLLPKGEKEMENVRCEMYDVRCVMDGVFIIAE